MSFMYLYMNMYGLIICTSQKFMLFFLQMVNRSLFKCVNFLENFIFNKIIPHLKWCSINSIFSIGIWTPQEAPSVFAMDTAQNFTDRKELKTPLFTQIKWDQGSKIKPNYGFDFHIF